ncbi:hypothetical protein MTR67_004361 [Solanum verrucosum]|uniref:Reverse transcriptase zinc-binding domain-containing protein n=1 Tax=Solanum verrucosum TaxID=315347 RepID=A0AAF0PYR2_SOLVR|nr:hypothetical protein MTR67_004361 [Solanum verrucosum]
MAPTKVKCFTWQVVKRACLTHHEVLQKKGRVVVTRYFLCNGTGETNNHLFLHCKFTTQLWNLFLSFTKTEWTMREHTADLMSFWMRRGGGKSQKKWRRLIPSCIWWTFGRERNQRCFEDKSISLQRLKINCLVLIYFWRIHEYPQEAEDSRFLLLFEAVSGLRVNWGKTVVSL